MFFFSKFLLNRGPFCGETGTLCFGLRITLPMSFKVRVDQSLPMLFCRLPLMMARIITGCRDRALNPDHSPRRGARYHCTSPTWRWWIMLHYCVKTLTQSETWQTSWSLNCPIAPVVLSLILVVKTVMKEHLTLTVTLQFRRIIYVFKTGLCVLVKIKCFSQ